MTARDDAALQAAAVSGDAPGRAQSGHAALRVTDLSTGYRGRPVIRGLTLPEIRPGELYSLIGPNAAGKSTLLRALAGLLRASGSVSLGDRELLGIELAEHARHVTYMPQTVPQ